MGPPPGLKKAQRAIPRPIFGTVPFGVSEFALTQITSKRGGWVKRRPGVDIIVTTLPRWGGGGGLLSQEAVMTE